MHLAEGGGPHRNTTDREDLTGACSARVFFAVACEVPVCKAALFLCLFCEHPGAIELWRLSVSGFWESMNGLTVAGQRLRVIHEEPICLSALEPSRHNGPIIAVFLTLSPP